MPENLPTEKPNEEAQAEKRKTNKIWLILLIAIILFAAIGLAVYAFLPASDSDTDDTGTPASMEAEEAATPSATSTEEAYSCSAQVYESSEQGYKVCYPDGWVNRGFGTSATTVGFDPINIPEASEYAGLIVVSVSGSDMASAQAEIEGALESPSTTTTTVDGAAATQISGTEPENLVNSGGPVIKTLFSHFDRLYVVTLQSNTTENKASYDDFLDSWRFLDTAAASPPE